MARRVLLNKLVSINAQIKKAKIKLSADPTKLNIELKIKDLVAKAEYVESLIIIEQEHEAKRREEKFAYKAEFERAEQIAREARVTERAKWKAEQDACRRWRGKELRRAKAAELKESTTPTAVQAWLGA